MAGLTDNRAPLTKSATTDATGVATVAFQVRGPHVWRVRQIGVTMPSAGSVIGQMLFNGSPVSPFFPPDAIAGDPPIDMGPGDEITLTVTGAAPGTVLTGAMYFTQLE